MIQKQNININFQNGLDTKTDPWQVAPGNFLRLENQVFTKGNRLTKRNGYKQISTIIDADFGTLDTSSTHITTLNGNLIALGNSVTALNESTKSWNRSQNPYQPLELNTLPLVRNSSNQIQCDAAVAPNGLVCTVYTEVGVPSGGTSTRYFYTIADSVTGQNVVPPSAALFSGGTSGSPRVFVLGNLFVIVATRLIASVSHLQYIAISLTTPANVLHLPQDIASAVTPSPGVNWDGVVVGDRLFIAFNTTSGGQAVKVTYLSATTAAAGGAPVSPVVFAGFAATLMATCADTANETNPIIYASFYDTSGMNGYSLAVDRDLNTAMIPVQIYTNTDTANITAIADQGQCSIYYEVVDSFSYDSSIPNHYIEVAFVSPAGPIIQFRSVFSNGVGTITASSGAGLTNGMYLIDATTHGNIFTSTTFSVSGVTLTLSHITTGASAVSPGDLLMAQEIDVSTQGQIVLSVGLASKAFFRNHVPFAWVIHQSQNQPTYFLVNLNSVLGFPIVGAKLAYQNGGGYLTLGLPSVTVLGDVFYFPYLFKDLIAPVNKNTNVPSGTQVTGVYSQTGINLCRFILGTSNIQTSEIGKDLLISGGFLWMYDGLQLVEQNFFLYPENIEAATQADPTPTGDLSSSVTPTIITNVSSTAGIVIGMTVTDTDNPSTIPANTTVVAVDSVNHTITMSASATASHTSDHLKFVGAVAAQKYFYQVVFEYTDNQGNLYQSAPSIPVTVTATSGHTSVVLNIPYLNLTYKGEYVNIVIYRWSAAQPVYYQVTSVIAPLVNLVDGSFATYIDIASDSEILGNAIIYTNGGVVENTGAPASSIFTLFDNRFWMVDAEDPDLLLYSKQVIEGVPVEMSDLLTFYVAPTQGAQGSTGHTTAIAPMDDKLIIFKPNAIYYINGTGPDNTGSNNQYSQPIFITSTVGCDNQNSIVFQPGGLMFQSEKGLWLLGRDLSTTYIGAPVEEFNASVTQSAVSVPETNQVRFTLDTGETLMYDYFYGQWGTFKGVPAISSCIYQGLHTFLNASASIFQESPGTYMDGSNPVLLGLTTGWFNLAGLQGYQRAFFFYLLGKYITPHKLNISIAYDYNPAPSQSSLITPTNFAGVYGGPTPNPGNGTDGQSPLGQQALLGGEGNVEQWRIFLSRQRCQSFQISIQEVFDGSFGLAAGEGCTLSGINLVYGVKKGFRPMAARHSIGGGQ